jgi:hypothetical protein
LYKMSSAMHRFRDAKSSTKQHSKNSMLEQSSENVEGSTSVLLRIQFNNTQNQLNIVITRFIKFWLPISKLFHIMFYFSRFVRRVWRYQRGNQNPYIEEEQATQWLKGKVQRDKQRYTKHKTKDRVTYIIYQ